VFSECDWLDPINDTRVDDFNMVEVKHESHYLCNNILLANQVQHVYYLSYPHQSFKNWWVVYKVNPEMHTYRYVSTWNIRGMMMSFMSIKNK
jgi:hypothetical protein